MNFEEIRRPLRSGEPPILVSLSVQKLTQQVLSEVVSDPLNDVDNDPYEEGNETHRQPRSYQVIFFVYLNCTKAMSGLTTYCHSVLKLFDFV